jgi:hypothetical protein
MEVDVEHFHEIKTKTEKAAKSSHYSVCNQLFSIFFIILCSAFAHKVLLIFRKLLATKKTQQKKK